jgi:hypothetical protein
MMLSMCKEILNGDYFNSGVKIVKSLNFFNVKSNRYFFNA